MSRSRRAKATFGVGGRQTPRGFMIIPRGEHLPTVIDQTRLCISECPTVSASLRIAQIIAIPTHYKLGSLLCMSLERLLLLDATIGHPVYHLWPCVKTIYWGATLRGRVRLWDTRTATCSWIHHKQTSLVIGHTSTEAPILRKHKLLLLLLLMHFVARHYTAYLFLLILF